MVQNDSGPVPPDSFDIWDTIVAAASSSHPASASPRTMIVHEYDDVKHIFAIREGHYKLVWGNVGVSDWIADVDYAGHQCGVLQPPDFEIHVPTNSNLVEIDMALGFKQLSHELDLNDDDTAVRALSCTDNQTCLFDVVHDPNEHQDPVVRKLSCFDNLTQKLC